MPELQTLFPSLVEAAFASWGNHRGIDFHSERESRELGSRKIINNSVG
jgi:hypothetical protein